MDRMQPPPNYYGAPFPNPNVDPNTAYKPPYVGPQPPQPNQPMPQPDPYDQMNNLSKIQGQSLKDSTRFFIGKKIKIYCSFPDSAKWHDVVFEGVLVEAEDDHMAIRDGTPGKLTIIVGVYVNYLELWEN